MAPTTAVLLADDTDDEPVRPLRLVPGTDAERSPDPLADASTQGVILVADDDDALRESVVEILTLAGHVVLQAKDGDAVLEVLRMHNVDVLVLDLAMPRLDGPSVLSRLGTAHPKVILHSAFEYYSADHVDRAGLGGKVFRMIRKPVPPAELLAVVAAALAP